MSDRRRYGNRVEDELADRVEADVIRFDVTKLESGLYQHVPVKYIFELSRKDDRRRQRSLAALS